MDSQEELIGTEVHLQHRTWSPRLEVDGVTIQIGRASCRERMKVQFSIQIQGYDRLLTIARSLFRDRKRSFCLKRL